MILRLTQRRGLGTAQFEHVSLGLPMTSATCHVKPRFEASKHRQLATAYARNLALQSSLPRGEGPAPFKESAPMGHASILHLIPKPARDFCPKFAVTPLSLHVARSPLDH